MSRRLTTYVRRFVAEGRYHYDIMDTSGAAPRVIAGYSYPLPARKGQTDDLPKLPNHERALCIVRNHKSATTVNGVCLECATARGKHV